MRLSSVFSKLFVRSAPPRFRGVGPVAGLSTGLLAGMSFLMATACAKSGSGSATATHGAGASGVQDIVLTAIQDTVLKADKRDSSELTAEEQVTHLCRIPLGTVIVVSGAVGNPRGTLQALSLKSVTPPSTQAAPAEPQSDAGVSNGAANGSASAEPGAQVPQTPGSEVKTQISQNATNPPCALTKPHFYRPHFSPAPSAGSIAFSSPDLGGPTDGAVSPQGYVWPTSTRAIRNDAGGEGHWLALRGGGARRHQGIDIMAGRNGDNYAGYGAELRAAKAGVIAWKDFDAGGYGNFMQISHEGNQSTRYGHFHTITRATNARVERGEVIGVAGRTGNAAGGSIKTHVHFEVLSGAHAVNPMDYLPR